MAISGDERAERRDKATRLAQRLREARLAQGLTMTEVAKAVSTDLSYISKIEGVRQTTSPYMLKRITDLLELDYTQLLEECGYGVDDYKSENFGKSNSTPDESHTSDIVHTPRDFCGNIIDQDIQVQGATQMNQINANTPEGTVGTIYDRCDSVGLEYHFRARLQDYQWFEFGKVAEEYFSLLEQVIITLERQWSHSVFWMGNVVLANLLTLQRRDQIALSYTSCLSNGLEVQEFRFSINKKPWGDAFIHHENKWWEWLRLSDLGGSLIVNGQVIEWGIPSEAIKQAMQVTDVLTSKGIEIEEWWVAHETNDAVVRATEPQSTDYGRGNWKLCTAIVSHPPIYLESCSWDSSLNTVNCDGKLIAGRYSVDSGKVFAGLHNEMESNPNSQRLRMLIRLLKEIFRLK